MFNYICAGYYGLVEESAAQIEEKIKEKQQTSSDDQQVEMELHCQRVAKAKAGLVLGNQLNKEKKEVKELTEQNKISGV